MKWNLAILDILATLQDKKTVATVHRAQPDTTATAQLSTDRRECVLPAITANKRLLKQRSLFASLVSDS